MIWDSRYFPWLDQLYTGSDSRHAYLDLEGFFVTGGEAFRYQHRANKDEQIITIPELWGPLQLADVGAALVAVGKPNPIPADWQWLVDFNALMPCSMQGAGVSFSGYAPLGKHLGIGGSAFLMKLNSFVCVLPTPDSASKLNLKTPGNQALFTQMVDTMYQELGIVSTTFQQVGVGDVVVYLSIHDTHEYRFKFRKLDWGMHLGMIIPCGLRRDPANLASVPFGGEYGLWGWFAAPFAEFELKEDLKFGIQGRIIKRIDRCFTTRIPVGKEQPLFGPIIGKVGVDSGTTFSIAPYFAFEDIRAGLGLQAKYTITIHERDYFSSTLAESDVRPVFKDMNYYSGWTQEYATIRLFYDLAHDKTWKNRPFFSFAWDIPMNHIQGRGFAKTNRISIGCNVNF